MLAVASQKPEVLERYGVTRPEADRAAWTIDAAGNRLEGAAALNRVLDEVGGGWAVLAAPYRLSPIAAVEEAAYRWFAPRRSEFHRFGVTPECEQPEGRCA